MRSSNPTPNHQRSNGEAGDRQGMDPSQVAKYPVYQLFYEDLTDEAEATDRASRVELDGTRVEPAPGQAPREAAIAAIAKKARDHQRNAVRVVVTNAENQRWKMIVTAEGEAIDLTDDHEAKTKPPGKKKLFLLAGGGLLGVAVTATATAVVLVASTQDGETVGTEPGEGAAPAWEPPHAGAEVPIGLPDDYSNSAAWVAPVDEGSGVMELNSDTGLSSDTLVLIDPDGRLQGVDAETAEPLWSATDAPDSVEDLHETTWAAEPVLAEVTSSRLRLWHLPAALIPAGSPDEPVQPHSVEPHTVELGHQAEVTFVGDSPLVDLGDYVVAADTGDGTLTDVGIPAGAEPLLVSDGEVVSMDGTHVYHSPITAAADPDSPAQNSADQGSDSQDSDGRESNSTELAHHSAVQNPRPQSVWPLTAEVIAGVYEGEDDEPVLQLFSIDGERLATSYLDSPPANQDAALVDAEAETAVIGPVGISWGSDVGSAEPEISDLTPPRDPLLHGTTLWGEDTEGPARLDITDPEAEPQVYEAFSDEDPAPVLVTEEAAYVEAPRVDQTLLYRAKNQAENEPPTGSPGNDAEDDNQDEEQE